MPEQQFIPNPIVTDMNERISDLETKTQNVESLLVKICQVGIETYKVQQKILQQLLDRRDEGGSIKGTGTLTSTKFVVIDTMDSPNHPVKGYMVENTGSNDLYFGHNLTDNASLDLDITLDVLKANPIFIKISPNEVERVDYNVDCIDSVHLIAATGTTTYKIKLIW